MESPDLRLRSGYDHGGLAGYVHGCGLYVPEATLVLRLWTSHARSRRVLACDTWSCRADADAERPRGQCPQCDAHDLRALRG